MAADHRSGGAPSSPFSSIAEGFLLAARSWSAAFSAPSSLSGTPSTAPPFCPSPFASSPSPNATSPDAPLLPPGAPALCVPPGPISQSVFGLLSFLGVDMSSPSPVTHSWPAVASPAQAVVAVLGYLLVVGAWTQLIRLRGLQPHASEPRPLKALVLAHNLFLCALSFYMGSGLTLEAYRDGYTLWGNRCTDSNPRMAFYIYVFYLSKMYEFVDTVIMLLKRNLRQVSYLHVYHHATICFIWWILCFRCPVGDTYFSAAFNSWIHVIMYSYYFLAAAIGKDERRRKKYLFWGKYLTMLQMAQFVSFIGQAVYHQVQSWVYPGMYPEGIDRLLFFYSLSLLLFFLDFFVKKHLLGSRSRRPKAAEVTAKKEN